MVGENLEVTIAINAVNNAQKELDNLKVSLERVNAVSKATTERVAEHNAGQSKLGEVLNTTSGVLQSMAGSTAGLGSALGLATLAGAAFTGGAMAMGSTIEQVASALSGLATGYARWANEVSQLSATTGLSLEATASWGQAFEVAGIGAGSLTRVAMQLSQAQQQLVAASKDSSVALGSQAQAMDSLGVRAVAANGVMKSQDDLLRTVFERLSQVTDRQERYNTAIELFGPRGRQMLVIAENYEDIMGRVNKIDEDHHRNFERLQDDAFDYNEAMTSLNESMLDMKQTVGPPFISFLASVASSFASIMTAARDAKGAIDETLDSWGRWITRQTENDKSPYPSLSQLAMAPITGLLVAGGTAAQQVMGQLNPPPPLDPNRLVWDPLTGRMVPINLLGTNYTGNGIAYPAAATGGLPKTEAEIQAVLHRVDPGATTWAEQMSWNATPYEPPKPAKGKAGESDSDRLRRELEELRAQMLPGMLEMIERMSGGFTEFTLRGTSATQTVEFFNQVNQEYEARLKLVQDQTSALDLAMQGMSLAGQQGTADFEALRIQTEALGIAEKLIGRERDQALLSFKDSVDNLTKSLKSAEAAANSAGQRSVDYFRLLTAGGNMSTASALDMAKVANQAAMNDIINEANTDATSGKISWGEAAARVQGAQGRLSGNSNVSTSSSGSGGVGPPPPIPPGATITVSLSNDLQVSGEPGV